MNMLIKKKEKRSKKERKNNNSKDKILGVKNPLRSKYFVFAVEENSPIFCKLFLGRDSIKKSRMIISPGFLNY